MLGHSSREIRLAVIKAIKAGLRLRKLFQGQIETMSDESFLSMLRSNYPSKNAQKLMDEMGKCRQEAGQKEIDFVVDIMGQRDTILAVNKDEEFPIPENTIMKKFFHTLTVGFRSVAVRLELRPILKVTGKSSWISDEDLCKEVRLVMDREEENMEKTGNDEVVVKSVEVDNREGASMLKEMGRMHSKMEELNN